MTISLDEAQLTIDRDGTLTVDDPDSPLLITVGLGPDGRIDHLSIVTRHPTGRINGATLGRIPIGRIERLARTIAGRRPGEAWMNSLADQRPDDARSWGDDHWWRVRAVADWARRGQREGGASRAIADLWGVSTATAYRWMANARAASATGPRTPDRTPTPP